MSGNVGANGIAAEYAEGALSHKYPSEYIQFEPTVFIVSDAVTAQNTIPKTSERTSAIGIARFAFFTSPATALVKLPPRRNKAVKGSAMSDAAKVTGTADQPCWVASAVIPLYVE